MTIPWKLILDVSFFLLVSGALGFIIFVEQKEVFMYINMSLISILCIIYSFYFSSVRMIDLKSWLDENRFEGGESFRRITRDLRILISIRLPFWSLKKFDTIIVLMYLPFTALMFVIATTCENVIMATTCIILATISILYVLVPMRLLSDMKMRFKIKMHGGALLIFSGVFLLFSDYSILLHYVGGALVIVGANLYYNIWKQYSRGVRLFFDAHTTPVSNGQLPGRAQ